MKFHSLIPAGIDTNTSLESEYKNAREIGIIKLGESNLFFRRKWKVFYIPYKDITRCFRRVYSVPAMLCCGKGNLEIENLVVYSNDAEIAMIQLPGTKAAKILMDELKNKIPNAQFSRPDENIDTMKETSE